MQQTTFRAMGCQVLAIIDADHAQAAAQLERVPEWFAVWEQHLSRFRADSELSRLNQRDGQVVQVSSVLWAVVHEALLAARQSDGLVTPAVLGALEAAGYDRSFEERSAMPGGVSSDGLPGMAISQPVADWRGIRLDLRRRTVWLPTGVRLDLGGVAKGWAAAQAARRLSRFGPALVDAGGDIAISGPRSDGSGWPIGVANPLDAADILEVLLLDRGGVATSGRDYRRWRYGDVWQHHIIDPRSGRPAQTDVLSVTVVAPAVSEAEVAAKVVLILGSAAGLAWIEARPALAGLVVCADGRVIRSSRWQQYSDSGVGSQETG